MRTPVVNLSLDVACSHHEILNRFMYSAIRFSGF